jgi:predicted AAA+ superfamily ATPase
MTALTKKDFVSDQEVRWCPGCGDYAILAQVQKVLPELGGSLRGLVVIDEFQRQPGLFELLRVLADRKPRPARFLILGSASLDLVRGASETLAGRIAYCEMSGFNLVEVGAKRQTPLWLRGGFPPSLLARSDADSFAWRQSFMQTFLERDVPQLGIRVSAHALRRFWTMLAHYHGQIWNAADLARSMGTGETAVRHHLDILCGAFMARRLPPWFENVGKRLVKSPKVYLRDSGLLHCLLGLRDRLELFAHPKLGASWEGFAVDQVIRLLGAERDAFFYRTQAGAELDLFVIRGGRRYGFEFKHTDAPRPTKSMGIALDDLQLEEIFVVHPGERSYGLANRISAVALQDLSALVRKKRLR